MAFGRGWGRHIPHTVLRGDNLWHSAFATHLSYARHIALGLSALASNLIAVPIANPLVDAIAIAVSINFSIAISLANILTTATADRTSPIPDTNRSYHSPAHGNASARCNLQLRRP